MAPRARYGPKPVEKAHWIVPRLIPQSPLLSLPDHLRVKIYHYVFSNMVIEIGTAYHAPDSETSEYSTSISRMSRFRDTHLSHNKTYYLTARENRPDSFAKNLDEYAGFVFACRKLYTETHALLFALSTTDIGISRLLQAPQKNAIATIQIESFSLIDATALSEIQGTENSFQKLHILKGLKRVIVENKRERFTILEEDEEAWAARLRGYARNEGLEVVFTRDE